MITFLKKNTKYSTYLQSAKLEIHMLSPLEESKIPYNSSHSARLTHASMFSVSPQR